MGKFFFQREKKNNSVVTLLIIIFFIVAVIYSIIMLISNAFTKPEIYYKTNIEAQTEELDKVYNNMFYILDNQVANFLEAVDRQMYSRLYAILENNYDKVYSRSEVIKHLKEYRENIFKYSDGKSHVYTGHLLNAYTLENGKYLLQLDFDDGNFYMVIGSGQKNYTFTFVE